MLAGLEDSEYGRAHAGELLEAAAAERGCQLARPTASRPQPGARAPEPAGASQIWQNG